MQYLEVITKCAKHFEMCETKSTKQKSHKVAYWLAPTVD